MSPFNQPKGMVAYGDIGIMLKFHTTDLLNISGQDYM